MGDSGRGRNDGRRATSTPLHGRESTIRWARTRPASVAEITSFLDRIEAGEGRPAPPVKDLTLLVRDAFTAVDVESTDEAERAVNRAYPLFREAATVSQRLAVIEEAWSLGFDDGRWPFSLSLATILEREPSLIAASAARYGAFVMMFSDFAAGEIARLMECAEYESETCRAATFLGLMAVGDGDLLHQLRFYRSELTDEDVATICGIPLLNPSLATIVFLLEWMEEAQRCNEHAQFEQLASAVARSGAVLDSAAPAPAAVLDAGDLRLQICYRPRHHITREKFLRQIQPRLETLAGRETGTRIIPPVLEAWGLQRCREAS